MVAQEYLGVSRFESCPERMSRRFLYAHFYDGDTDSDIIYVEGYDFKVDGIRYRIPEYHEENSMCTRAMFEVINDQEEEPELGSVCFSKQIDEKVLDKWVKTGKWEP